MNGFMSLGEIALNWSDQALMLAIDAGMCAGLIAIIVLVINVLCRRWLTSQQMGLLWGVVLLRLLVPFAPSSSFSLQNLVMPAMTILSAQDDVDLASSVNDYSEPNLQPVAAIPAISEFEPDSASVATTFETNLSAAIELLFMRIPLIWLAIGTSYLLWIAIAHWRFCRRLSHVGACNDPRLGRLWEECCKQAGIRKHIPILLFDGVEQPAILGLVRPKLLLPSLVDLNDQQLRMVMFHELAHVRRRDIAVNWLLVVVRAIHWWNPVYWLAATRLQSLREQSCDAFAIRQMEGSPIRGYSELLLTLSLRRPAGPRWRVMLPASLLGFFSSFFRKRAVHHRLKALRSANVMRSRWQTAVVTGLIAVVAVGGLTDASIYETPTDQSFDWPTSSPTWASVQQVDTGSTVSRTYDIEKALHRIAADHRTKEDARIEMDWMLVHILRQSSGRYQTMTNEWAKEQFTLSDTTLTLNASPDLHAEIATHLAAWEQSGLVQTSIQIQFITDERDIASAIGVSWQYLETISADGYERFRSRSSNGAPVIRAHSSIEVYLPIATATLSGQQASEMVQRAQAANRGNVLNAPKITVFNGYQATLEDCSHRPFVVGTHADTTGVQQPKVVIVDEGTKLTIRAIRSIDAGKTQLDARLTLSQIGEVYEASTLLRGKKTPIQIPRVNKCQIDVCSELQDGQTLLIGSIPTHEHKRYFYTLLTVHHIEPTADATN